MHVPYHGTHIMARYFHKVWQTEWVPIIHGDPDLEPDVVELPPENVFWGPPKDPDEVLTFDGAGLPLALVARVIPPELLLKRAMRDAGLTQAAMERATYLARRGDLGPLTALDNALDALVLSEGATLEALLELM